MKNKVNKSSSIMRVVLTGIILGPAIMLISSVILSFAALKIGNPLSVIFPMALFAVFAGGFISALKSANDYKEQPIRAGIYTCLGNLIIIVIVALISSTFSGGFREAFFPPAVLIVSSALGILAGTRIKPSTKRRLKKLRRQVR